jgi:hypothetical protein
LDKITKVGILSLAKFQTILGALIGLLCGLIYSFGGLLVDTLVTLGWYATDETPGLSYGTVLAFGALVGMPLIFATAGFVLGLVGAFLFNIYTSVFGGIDLKFESDGKENS